MVDGNSDLTILPQIQLPKLVDPLSVDISPIELYKKFGNGDAKSLVSFQAIAALFVYYGGESLIAKRAMDECKENVIFQVLPKEKDEHYMKFDKIANIAFYFLQAFLTLENEFDEHQKLKLEISNKTIDASSEVQIAQTSTPKRTPIPRPPLPPSLFDTYDTLSETDLAFLKTSLTMSKPNLDVSIEVAENENEKIIRDIVDPTPGFVVDDNFTDADLENRGYENEAEFKLGNAAQKRLDTILDDVNKSISFVNESSIQFEKEKNENKGFTIKKSNQDIEISKSTFQTKIDTVKRKNIKRSPYKLRARKRQFAESPDSLMHKPYLYQTIFDEEKNKIKAAESIIDSIVKQLPDQRKKLKFDLDATNDIKLTELSTMTMKSVFKTYSKH